MKNNQGFNSFSKSFHAMIGMVFLPEDTHFLILYLT